MSDSTKSTPPATETAVSAAASSASSSNECDESKKIEFMKKADDLISQGKRNMVCGEVPKAVNAFEEAVKMLVSQHGEMSPNCAQAYFHCGCALLELCRMESSVLGSALDGVEVEEEKEMKESEQFEKPPQDDDERDKLREQVYEAMSEEQRLNEKSDKKDCNESDTKQCESKTENGETEEKMDVDNQKEISEDKTKSNEKNDSESSTAKKSEKADQTKPKESVDDQKENKSNGKNEKLEKEEKNGKDTTSNKEIEKDDTPKKEEKETSEKEKEASKKDEKDINKEAKQEEKSKANGDTNDVGSEKCDGKSNEKEMKDQKINQESNEKVESNGDLKTTNGDHDNAMETEDSKADKENDTAEDDDEEGSEGEENDDGGDDVSHFQLAWEYLDVAKVIFMKMKDNEKENQLMSADCLIKLGELSMENEQHETAASDLEAALKIQKQHLESHDRVLAETHYQLGLAYSLAQEFEKAIQAYQDAITVIEAKIVSLNKMIEESDKEKDSEAVTKYNKEIKDLEELVPEMKNKIEDVKSEQKDKDKMAAMAREMLGLSGTSKGFGSPKKAAQNGVSSDGAASSSSVDENGEVKAKPIQMLVRKKRKPEDEVTPDSTQDIKKSRQEGESAEAKVNGVNGNSSEAETKAAPTPSPKKAISS